VIAFGFELHQSLCGSGCLLYLVSLILGAIDRISLAAICANLADVKAPLINALLVAARVAPVTWLDGKGVIDDATITLQRAMVIVDGDVT
jgi:hypothetical protein